MFNKLYLTFFIILINSAFSQDLNINNLYPKSSITFSFTNGWELRFGMDGAGMLYYGASAQHSTAFPPHTIDEKMITQLLDSLSTNKSNISDIEVHIIAPRQKKYPVYYTANLIFVESIFKLGIEKGAALDPVQFNRALSEKPPWGNFLNSSFTNTFNTNVLNGK